MYAMGIAALHPSFYEDSCQEPGCKLILVLLLCYRLATEFHS